MAVPVIESYSTNNGTTGTATVAWPSGISDGDLIVVIGMSDDNSASQHWITDGTLTLKTTGGSSTYDIDFGVYCYDADGTETGNISITLNDTNDDWILWAFRISGADVTASQFDVVGTWEGQSDTNARVVDEVTTTVDDCLAFCILGTDGADLQPFSISGTGWSEHSEQGRAGANGVAGVVATKSIATAGLTGDCTVTPAAVNDGSAAVQFAIAPGGAASYNENHDSEIGVDDLTTQLITLPVETAEYEVGIDDLTTQLITLPDEAVEYEVGIDDTTTQLLTLPAEAPEYEVGIDDLTVDDSISYAEVPEYEVGIDDLTTQLLTLPDETVDYEVGIDDTTTQLLTLPAEAPEYEVGIDDLTVDDSISFAEVPEYEVGIDDLATQLLTYPDETTDYEVGIDDETTDSLFSPGVPVIKTSETNTGFGSAPTVTKPSGVVTGDHVLIIGGDDDQGAGAGHWQAHADFEEVLTAGGSTSDSKLGVYIREIDGTEGASFTFALASDADWVIWAIRISGCDPVANPVDIVGTPAETTGAGDRTVAAVTTTVAECLAFSVVATDGADLAPFGTTGTGWTEWAEGGVNGANGVGVSISTKSVESAGTTGACTVSVSADDGAVDVQFAIAPVPSLIYNETPEYEVGVDDVSTQLLTLPDEAPEYEVGIDDTTTQLLTLPAEAPDYNVGVDDLTTQLLTLPAEAPEHEVGIDDVSTDSIGTVYDETPQYDVGIDDLTTQLITHPAEAPDYNVGIDDTTTQLLTLPSEAPDYNVGIDDVSTDSVGTVYDETPEYSVGIDDLSVDDSISYVEAPDYNVGVDDTTTQLLTLPSEAPDYNVGIDDVSTDSVGVVYDESPEYNVGIDDGSLDFTLDDLLALLDELGISLVELLALLNGTYFLETHEAEFGVDETTRDWYVGPGAVDLNNPVAEVIGLIKTTHPTVGTIKTVRSYEGLL